MPEKSNDVTAVETVSVCGRLSLGNASVFTLTLPNHPACFPRSVALVAEVGRKKQMSFRCVGPRTEQRHSTHTCQLATDSNT